MSPIPLEGDIEKAMERLESVIRKMPRSRIVTSKEDYLHAEFRSLTFGFVDDVELQIDVSNKLIHFLSASRIGHSDLGVNRKRMEEISRRVSKYFEAKTTSL